MTVDTILEVLISIKRTVISMELFCLPDDDWDDGSMGGVAAEVLEENDFTRSLESIVKWSFCVLQKADRVKVKE